MNTITKFSIVVIICFIFSNPSSGGTYSDGDGTKEAPYQIATVADWQELMGSSSDWGEYFILTADIDLQGITLTPVGDDANGFSGVFEGNGHVICNADIKYTW